MSQENVQTNATIKRPLDQSKSLAIAAGSETETGT